MNTDTAPRPPPRRIPARVHVVRGWTAALQTVWRGLAEIPEGGLAPDQEAFRDSVLELLDLLRPGEDKLKPKPTVRQLARKYGCCQRSIHHWRKAGAPLDEGQWRMLDWLADRHCVPRGTAAKFQRQLARRKEPEEAPDADPLGRLAAEVKAIARAVREFSRRQAST